MILYLHCSGRCRNEPLIWRY